MQNKQLVYQQLEAQMLRYSDLKQIKSNDCGEKFVLLPKGNNLVVGRYTTLLDMEGYFPQIPVRKTVYDKLLSAGKQLQVINPNFKLLVTYGFRSIEIQNEYFQRYLKKFQKKYTKKDQLYESVHRLVAVPEVAGHPTGGAIDVTILENGKPLDMGVKIYDFSSRDIYALSPFIGKEAVKNRSILRGVMIANGFAAFDGEWWHYSYGDKEWACYYKKKNAIYEQKSVDQVINT